ncbi:hypothetical protein SNE40_021509 [Patella caerulea]|uniref:Uncharacterized protein n=1 Tax=Patella caerulea TaxID=87958 RepID=A0AAN8IZ57_PATCE
MPKIVLYQPQETESDSEIDIADQEPSSVILEPSSATITCNRLTTFKSLSPSLPKREIRHSPTLTKKYVKESKVKTPTTTEMDVCKISMPCNTGCCYCSYGSGLGPVKVLMSNHRSSKHSAEKLMENIKDGRGQKVIPTSRKSDLKGLVFDKDTFSFHPPVRDGLRSRKFNTSKQ